MFSLSSYLIGMTCGRMPFRVCQEFHAKNFFPIVRVDFESTTTSNIVNRDHTGEVVS